mmetsp:Transcript_57616/g.108417  ORF Transcript_57616/g.108417 Transcript_57616/m.108417 type:complete len:100 (-) Transcript_57616:1159-1458(-)
MHFSGDCTQNALITTKWTIGDFRNKMCCHGRPAGRSSQICPQEYLFASSPHICGVGCCGMWTSQNLVQSCAAAQISAAEQMRLLCGITMHSPADMRGLL